MEATLSRFAMHTLSATVRVKLTVSPRLCKACKSRMTARAESTDCERRFADIDAKVLEVYMTQVRCSTVCSVMYTL